MPFGYNNLFVLKSSKPFNWSKLTSSTVQYQWHKWHTDKCVAPTCRGRGEDEWCVYIWTFRQQTSLCLFVHILLNGVFLLTFCCWVVLKKSLEKKSTLKQKYTPHTRGYGLIEEVISDTELKMYSMLSLHSSITLYVHHRRLNYNKTVWHRNIGFIGVIFYTF